MNYKKMEKNYKKMENNYNRYDSYDIEKYNKKGLSYYFMRMAVDRTIYPYLHNLKGKDILEVGVGYGYYKDAYFSDNNVTGYDVNPQLGEHLGIEIVEGKANNLKDRIGDRTFDVVLSFFMTEYLSKHELAEFITQGISILKTNGKFATTIILDSGLGGVYTRLAQAKGIKKYSYTLCEIDKIMAGRVYRLIPLNSVCKIPFATLLEVSNEE